MIAKLISLAAIVALGIGGFFAYRYSSDKPLVTPKPITSFEECAAAGYPIMESYPEQCRTPEGQTFTKALPGGSACDSDAMICPNGTLVGRIAPACDFAACPVTIPSPQSGIKGQVLLGPTCPVERNPPDPQCADRLFATDLVVTTPDGASVVTTFRSDAAGAFSLALKPGSYVIRGNISQTLPRCSSDTFVVKTGAYTQVQVSCDSGIR